MSCFSCFPCFKAQLPPSSKQPLKSQHNTDGGAHYYKVLDEKGSGSGSQSGVSEYGFYHSAAPSIPPLIAVNSNISSQHSIVPAQQVMRPSTFFIPPFTSSINKSEILPHFKNNCTYLFSGEMQHIDFFIGSIIERFKLTNHVANGTTKVVFCNQDNDIVKIIFSSKIYYRLERSIKELEFLISNHNIANLPTKITIYLNAVDRKCFSEKYARLIKEHSIVIEQIDEPNFEGVITWKEEPYIKTVADAIRNPVPSEIKLIINFWEQILQQILTGKQFMVQDLSEVNIAFFKNGSIKIIDAQPSDVPLHENKVMENIKRYKDLLL